MATKHNSTANKSTGTGNVFPAFPAFLSAFTANLPQTPMTTSASWWQAYMSGATQMNREFMKFVATRLQHDVELSQSLAKCRDWEAVTSVHGDWIRQMSAEYAHEAKTLMDIASATAQQSWATATNQSDDAGARARAAND